MRLAVEEACVFSFTSNYAPRRLFARLVRAHSGERKWTEAVSALQINVMVVVNIYLRLF